MAKAPYQSYAADTAGNVLEWPFTVTVRREATGGIARIYDADDNPLANPLTVSELNGWAEGFFRFHAAGGSYRIDVTKGAYAAEPLRFVQIGTYAGADQGVINDPGYKYEFEEETIAPPSEGYFRANNADLSLATELYFHKTTRGGFDQAARLMALDPGTNTHRDVIFITGTDLGGASWEVDNADDSSGADDFVTLTVSGHAGATEFVTDVYSLTISIAGADGEDSAESVNGQTAAAANKATLADADMLPVVDSAAANALKHQTWAQRTTQLDARYQPLDADLTAFAAFGMSAFSGFLFGLTLANDTTDATNDLVIGAGKCADSTAAALISLSSMIKRLDAGWAPGTNQGMRNSGAAIANGTYHIYAVSKAGGADPDVYAHASADVATVITALQAETGGASYTLARRVGSIIRASAAIVPFSQDGDEFLLLTPVLDVSAASITTTASLQTLPSVPAGIKVEAVFNMNVDSATADAGLYLSSPDVADVAAVTGSGNTAPLGQASGVTNASGGGFSRNHRGPIWMRTDTSRRIRARASATMTLSIATTGWIDKRGRLN